MSKKVHVFNAGPCLLPQEAIDGAIAALKDFKGTGISVLSVSHRTKEWEGHSSPQAGLRPSPP